MCVTSLCSQWGNWLSHISVWDSNSERPLNDNQSFRLRLEKMKTQTHSWITWNRWWFRIVQVISDSDLPWSLRWFSALGVRWKSTSEENKIMGTINKLHIHLVCVCDNCVMPFGIVHGAWSFYFSVEFRRKFMHIYNSLCRTILLNLRLFRSHKIICLHAECIKLCNTQLHIAPHWT